YLISSNDGLPLATGTRSDLIHLLLSRYDATHGGRSSPNASRPAIAEKLLDPFRRIHFAGVDVAVAVHTHLVQVMELSGHSAAAPESAKFLKIPPVQNVDQRSLINCTFSRGNFLIGCALSAKAHASAVL